MTKRRNYVRRIPSPSSLSVPVWLAAEILGVSPSTIYQMRLRGEIPAAACSGSGRGTRILRSAIQETAGIS